MTLLNGTHCISARNRALAILTTVLLGACVTFTAMHAGRRDSGLKQPMHKPHADMDCGDCHAVGDNGQPAMPGHDICSACHDFDLEKPDERCAFCHTKPDYKTEPPRKILNSEVIFSHAPHAEKGVECKKCHTDPDRFVMPVDDLPLMKFCMDCHATVDPKLNACSVCHTELNMNVRPRFRNGVRLPHDSPAIWETIHGREWKRDEDYCQTCHASEQFCEDCHAKNPPRSHTPAWRGRPHGLQASWDRQKCQACHEEDSCIKCHENTAPGSHHGGWSEPLNRHCVNCHYPPSTTGCATCHEDIDHPKALASPHNFGVFPSPCGMCHPGGVPYRAPHLMNPGIRCVNCH